MSRRQLTFAIGTAIAVVLLVSWALLRSNAQKAASQEARTAPDTVSAVPTVLVTTVLSQELNRQLRLPGELQAYQDVALYSKVQGFVESITVDRGSVVKAGQALARLSAPELSSQQSEAAAKARAAQAQRSEGEARVLSVRAQGLEAEAKLAADEGTYKRLKAASATPGVVSGNELDIAERTVEADRARVRLWKESEKAAQSQAAALAETEKAYLDAARSMQTMESYLRITAPFDGVITERHSHPGSLVGPSGGPAAQPMLRIQQVSRLRLVVAIPETDVAGIVAGTKVSFSVPAFPGEAFTGVIERISHSLDVKTRTMAVELGVDNRSGRLSPGMYAEVAWQVRRPQASLFVPPSSVATTTERSFVILIRNDVAEWVDVKRGAAVTTPGGDLVEVFGDLAPGDKVAVRGTDELRAGTRVNVKEAQNK